MSLCYTELLRLNHLVSGYIGHYNSFEASLIKIIMNFAGNIFCIFDIHPPQCIDNMSENRSVYKRKCGDNLKGYLIGCSFGWNGGFVHRISIETKGSYWFFAGYGITSNIDPFRNSIKWIRDVKVGNHYGMFLGNIEGIEDGYQDTVQPQRNLNDFGNNGKNIITIQLDGYQWILTFSLNGKIVGHPIKVAENCIYHPMVMFIHFLHVLLSVHWFK